jgi:hypothetical protein
MSHFIPTSSSWLNLVERFFAEITDKRIRRSAFTSVAELEAANEDYLAKHNADPELFVWPQTADDTLAKNTGIHAALNAKIGYHPLELER